MAQKRMVDKKISVSEQVANLPVCAQLIFTWSIPHADDLGLLPHSLRTLKAMIVPMMEISLEEFEKNVKEIIKEKLWQEYEFSGEKFYRLVKFVSHQTLKKDRQPNVLINIQLDKDPKASWKKLEDIGFHMEDDGIQMESEEKGSKEKRREVKRREGDASVEYLKNIPLEDLKEFTDRFHVSEKVIQNKAEDLLLYCQSKGKKYKNYKSFLLNALKRDIKPTEKNDKYKLLKNSTTVL